LTLPRSCDALVQLPPKVFEDLMRDEPRFIGPLARYARERKVNERLARLIHDAARRLKEKRRTDTPSKSSKKDVVTPTTTDVKDIKPKQNDTPPSPTKH
jgi:hypothetical protein